jgi:hypothetical protein
MPCFHATAMVAAVVLLTPGIWGGEHARMVVTDTGARIEYECAESTIDQPITLDAHGNFSAKGVYTSHSGGSRRDDGAGGAPVRYSGRVRSGTMKLTVRLERGNQPIAVLTLKRGVDPLLTSCR